MKEAENLRANNIAEETSLGHFSHKANKGLHGQNTLFLSYYLLCPLLL